MFILERIYTCTESLMPLVYHTIYLLTPNYKMWNVEPPSWPPNVSYPTATCFVSLTYAYTILVTSRTNYARVPNVDAYSLIYWRIACSMTTFIIHACLSTLPRPPSLWRPGFSINQTECRAGANKNLQNWQMRSGTCEKLRNDYWKMRKIDN